VARGYGLSQIDGSRVLCGPRFILLKYGYARTGRRGLSEPCWAGGVVEHRLGRETAEEEAFFRESARRRARETYAAQLRRSLEEESAFLEEEVRATERAAEELSRCGCT